MSERRKRDFWSQVSVGDGCWEWTASVGKSGYGNFRVNNTRAGAVQCGIAVLDADPDEVLREHDAGDAT